MEEKPSLPIKTKIAAWWMRMIGIVWIFLGLAMFVLILPLLPFALGSFMILLIPGVIFCGILFFIFGHSLLKRKKWAWRSSIVLSLIVCLILISWAYDYWMRPRPYLPGFFVSIFLLVVNIFSLTLLILDRKNFWKIAT